MAIKVLATGDIHIGRKSSSIPQGMEVGAAKYTWNNIVEYAIRNDVDVLALTGDVVDQDNRFFEAIGPLQTGFEKLRRSKISVYMVAGNHDFDVLPQLINTERYDNIHLLGTDGVWEKEMFSKNGEQLQFVGWSFPSRHISEDPLLSFDSSKVDLNITTIGLVHGDVNVPESKYAPIDLNNFLSTSVNVWVLGHIHKPHTLRESDPAVFYPGSPHALSPKEQGKHGPVLISIRSQEDIQIKQIPLSPVRYENLFIDITNYTDESAVRDAVTSKLFEDAQSKNEGLEKVSFLIYDVTLIGHHSEIKALGKWVNPIVSDYDQEIDYSETRISVRKIIIDVQAKVDNLEELAQESSPAGFLARSIIALQNRETTEFTDTLLEEWKLIHGSIKRVGTYQPLRTAEGHQLDQGSEQYILNECNRLLTELIGQQQQ